MPHSGWKLKHAILAVGSILLIWQVFGILSGSGSILQPLNHIKSSQISGAYDISNPESLWSRNYLQTDIVSADIHISSKIAKVTSVYYDKNSRAANIYEDALRGHQEHDILWGYKHYVQRRGDLKYWSKPAYLQAIITAELGKPPAERLQWLFYHDSDIVLMNTLVPLETFLPPNEDKFSNITMLVSNDFNGLNNGAFFIRVCEQSVFFLAQTLAFVHYRPNTRIRLWDQGAMNVLLGEEPYKSTVKHVPQRWFNAFGSNSAQGRGIDPQIPPEWPVQHARFVDGDLLVHLAGVGANTRAIVMRESMESRVTNFNSYNIPLSELKILEEVKKWWATEADAEYQRMDTFWRQFWIIRHHGPPFDRKREKAEKELRKAMEDKHGKEEIDEAVRKLLAEHYLLKHEGLRKAYSDMLAGRILDHSQPDTW